MNTHKPKTQKQSVLYRLQTYGKLTRWTAFQELGIAELASRIGEIEKDGWLIPRKMIEVRTRNGKKVRVMQYGFPKRIMNVSWQPHN